MKLHLDTGFTSSGLRVTLCQRYLSAQYVTQDVAVVECRQCKARMNDHNGYWLEYKRRQKLSCAQGSDGWEKKYDTTRRD